MPVGTPVHAARDGVVALAEDSHDIGCWREECGRLANFIVLLHPDGTTGEYFHLQHGSVQVRLYQHVQRGELLAFSGNTGYTTAPHLHFGVYRTERDGQTQSLAIRFVTRSGMIREPREGARYLTSRALIVGACAPRVVISRHATRRLRPRRRRPRAPAHPVAQPSLLTAPRETRGAISANVSARRALSPRPTTTRAARQRRAVRVVRRRGLRGGWLLRA
jgi:murein DD-endopeptidase MepM/ murein hydrolase activator NlpD